MPIVPLGPTLPPAKATLIPFDLRCENLTNPEGIGRSRPQFSWKLRAAEATMKGLRQTAFQIRVGTVAGKSDLWDSGRVSSAAQYGIDFGGSPLLSGDRAFWSVRTWDANGNPSAWSRPASFSVGLLGESDWKAKWITWTPPDEAPAGGNRLKGSSWIWKATEDAQNAAVGISSFEKTFSLESTPAAAKLSLTADDRFVLRVNGVEVRQTPKVTDGWKQLVEVDLAPHLRAGTNMIQIEVENTTKSPAGLIARLSFGEDNAIVTDSSWTSGGLPVKVIAAYGDGPWGKFAEGKVLRPANVYGKTLEVTRKVVRATAHVTALGLVDMSINGKRVSEDLFTPGWTDYNTRVYARTYDVTQKLKAGANQISLEVGDGWYSGYVGYQRTRAHYGDRPLVRAQVVVEYSDGTQDVIGTDSTWIATTGSTQSQDFLAGEEYVHPANFANQTMLAGNATVVEKVKPKVEPFPGVPVRAYDRVKPIKITPQGDGYMIDFGQNLAGFAHLKAKGKPGQRVQMQFVEVLEADGTPHTANLRSAKATDSYTFGTNGVEEWEPRFTFHGFRYLKVTGLGRAPKPSEFTAVAISSATPEVSKFESSDPMLNKLAKNAWWTQKMNFIDVPTDCPQRDERLGWTGDAQAYIRTAATYSDVQTFFRKWLITLDDSQRADGQYPKVAPVVMGEEDGGPAWADAGVICPWTIYEVYGDRRLLAEHYPNMRRFIEYTRQRSTPDLLPPKNYHCFGDWLSINADTPNDVIYEAYFAYTTQLLAQSAEVLGYQDDVIKYRELHGRIRDAFAKAYVSPDGTVRGDTQTAYVLALGFDLIPDAAVREKAAQKLVANIESRGWHLSTGFVGTRDLMRVLSEIGRDDVAFRLLHNTTFPSWGFEIVNGATTVWERWNGWTPEGGLNDPGMNSFAHYAYGAVMGWVFQTIGGIDTAKAGFEEIRIAPRFDPNLKWAKTEVDTIRGVVRTEWSRSSKQVTVKVIVPPNTRAIVDLPGMRPQRIGSGEYTFTVR